MQTQLKITLQDLDHSAALDARIRAKFAKLQQAFPRLTRCHVVVSEPHRHRQNPRSFAITISITFPGGEVVVTRGDRDDVYVLVRDAFAAAERDLEKSLDRRAVRGNPHHGLAPRAALVNQEGVESKY
ncbi:MAG TPA: HPF/RaiA family ribosome-associated protein [Burkholderiales bacterium]|jgi:ribosomal subunit interface protein|nr:HPF/RaiA family ribosome-associated protein [Burkholderiales bacterium]